MNDPKYTSSAANRPAELIRTPGSGMGISCTPSLASLLLTSITEEDENASQKKRIPKEKEKSSHHRNRHRFSLRSVGSRNANDVFYDGGQPSQSVGTALTRSQG